MAAATVTEKLDDVLQCSICMENFTDPRALPCLHTFCFKCIGDWCRNRQPGDKVECPLCRHKFVIPDNGLVNLQRSFFIEKLLDIDELRNTETQSKPCDICAGVQEINPQSEQVAKVFCLECQQSLCKSCSVFHTKLRTTSSHKLVNIDEISKDVDVYKYRSTFCEEHLSRQVEVYCFDCKTTLCMMCYIKDHSSHKCSDLVDVVGDFCSDLKHDILNMTTAICKFNENLLVVGSKRNEFSNQVENVETAISQRADQLMKLIDTEKHRLFAELSEIKERHDMELNNLTQEIEKDISLVESNKKYYSELLQKGTAVDITREANRLRTRSEEMCKEKNMDEALKNLSISAVLYTPSNVNYDRNNSILGNVISKGSNSITRHHRSPINTVKHRIVYSSTELYELHDKLSCPSSAVLKALGDHGLLNIHSGSSPPPNDNPRVIPNQAIRPSTYCGRPSFLRSNPVAHVRTFATPSDGFYDDYEPSS